ncbi:hypothetical protein D3C86_1567980 [compost metagenome]
MAPAQFMVVARRVGEFDQRLNAALLDLGARAWLPFDTGGGQMLKCGLERRFAGQLPAGSQVPRLAAFDDQHAERTFVHFYVQATARRRTYLHAQHVLGIPLPVTEVFDLGDEIAQTANVDHAWVPRWLIRCMASIVQSVGACFIVH